MAIIGISLDRENPPFELDDFLFWMPQFGSALKEKHFNKLREISNQKIFKSIWGSDWEYGMSLCIAHYLELIAINERIPQSNSLKSLSGGQSFKGIVTSMTIGSFSKNIDVSSSLLKKEDSLFWNQTSYGASLMALYKTKSIPSIFVVTGS